VIIADFSRHFHRQLFTHLFYRRGWGRERERVWGRVGTGEGEREGGEGGWGKIPVVLFFLSLSLCVCVYAQSECKGYTVGRKWEKSNGQNEREGEI
jgi:hypothetical protein